MNANRPRHSILSLFDPLSAAAPDHDKENLPSLSVFLGHQSHPPVVLPKKRLVDIGDTTLDDAQTLDVLAEQDCDANGVQPYLKIPLPRTPLSELTLGGTDATPLTQGKLYPQPSTSSLLPPPMILASDVDYSSYHEPINDVDGMTPSNIQAPRIVISYNSVNNSPEKMPSHDDTATSLIPSPADRNEEQTVPPNRHLRAPSTASQDFNRFSLDLQASFQMYLQSEASFDLLNDKISLMEPMESLTTDDECFDFELQKDNLQDALSKLKRGRKADPLPLSPTQGSSETDLPGKVHEKGSNKELNNDILHSPTSPSHDHQLSQPIPSSLLGSSSEKSSKRWSTSPSIPSPTSHRGLKGLSQTPAKPVASAIPQSKQRRFSSPLATPQRISVVPPPAIQALRIVKRVKVPNAKVEPSSDAFTSAVTPRDAERSPLALPTTSALRSTVVPEAHPPWIHTSSVKPIKAVPSTSIVSAGLGPRRMTVTDNHVGVNVPKSNEPSLAGATLGPKRILISNDGSNLPLSKPSGLKQPRRFESSTSNLPRLSGIATGTSTSRLPGPINSQQSKLRRPIAGISRGGLSRRVVSGD